MFDFISLGIQLLETMLQYEASPPCHEDVFRGCLILPVDLNAIFGRSVRDTNSAAPTTEL